MLPIIIPEFECWDEKKQEFISIQEQKLKLEHSLVSLSKWESKWCKPFLSSEKTDIETIDYIKCMTITPNVNEYVYLNLTNENIIKIKEYIDSPMTARTFTKRQNKGFVKEIITSEMIYYWMIVQNIPFECEKWHLNRLLALIRTCSEKNEPDKKMTKRELMSRNAALNAERRKKLNTKG